MRKELSWEDLTKSKKSPILINRNQVNPSMKKSVSNPSLVGKNEPLMQSISTPRGSLKARRSTNLELVIEDLNEASQSSESSEL